MFESLRRNALIIGLVAASAVILGLLGITYWMIPDLPLVRALLMSGQALVLVVLGILFWAHPSERRLIRPIEHAAGRGQWFAEMGAEADLDLDEISRLQQVQRRRQRLESLGTLASGIAHDLNNLLTPILMSSKMLQRENASVDRAALLETIATGASRGADLIAQLLTFARGGDGVHQLIRFDSFLPEIVAILERTLPKGITLTLDVHPNLPEVLGDETEISQVVMNLAINARDAMGESGTMVIRASRRTLSRETLFSTTALQPGEYLSISVADSGTGIAPSIRDRIFEPFFSTKERGQGTGLGLSTTIGIVRSHQGAIDISTVLGEGTTVSVVIPVCEHQNAPLDLH